MITKQISNPMSNYTQSCEDMKERFEKHTPSGTYTAKAPTIPSSTIDSRSLAYHEETFSVSVEKENSHTVVNDNLGKRYDTVRMNDMTREELSTTLSAIEERMDKRIERMEKDSERRTEDMRREMRLRERSARRESIAMKDTLHAHIESNDRAVISTLSALERTEKEFGKVKQANKEQRYWMAGIGVAIVLGIMGANATIFGGGKAFFDGGKDAIQNQQKIDAIIQKAQEQTEANRRILDDIRASQLANPQKKS